MANYQDLKKGTRVWIKNPTQVYAEVIGPANFDKGLPHEEQSYTVQTISSTQYVRPGDLELADSPKDLNAPLDYASPQWHAEMSSLCELGQRFRVNQDDRELSKQVMASLMKLGFVVQKK